MSEYRWKTTVEADGVVVSKLRPSALDDVERFAEQALVDDTPERLAGALAQLHREVGGRTSFTVDLKRRQLRSSTGRVVTGGWRDFLRYAERRGFIGKGARS